MNGEEKDKGKEYWQQKKAIKYQGGKTVITKKLIDKMKDLKEKLVSQIVQLTKRSRTTSYKILKNELNSVPSNKLVRNEKYESAN